MLTLLWKDFSVERKTIANYTLLAAAMVFFFSRMESGLAFVSTWSVMLPFFYVSRLCYGEELAGGLGLLRALPVSPAAIVWSKFAGTLLATVFGGLAVAAAATLAIRTGWSHPGEGAVPYLTALSTLPPALILEGIFLWAFFRWDYRRASYFMLLPLVFLAFAFFPRSMAGLVQAAINLRQAYPVSLLAAAWCAFGLAIFLGLGALTARAFARKDVGR